MMDFPAEKPVSVPAPIKASVPVPVPVPVVAVKTEPQEVELAAHRFWTAGDFWTAPVLTYEQVKPRTEQPSPVRSQKQLSSTQVLTLSLKSAYLIDVREPDEVILGSIPSSVNIPLSTLSEALYMNPVRFKEKFGFEKPKRDQEIVFYCRSGKRSASASDIALKNGYTK